MKYPLSVIMLWIALSLPTAIARGQENQGLYVDGNDSCLQIPRDPSLEPSDALTLETWVKPEGWIGHGRIIRKAGDFDDGYMLSFAFSGVRFNALIDCEDYVDVNDTTDGRDYLGTWHHIAMTARAEGDLRLYVDGELVDSTPSRDCIRHSDDLYFGASFGFAEEFIGTIDEVRLWNIERTAEEIRSSYRRSFNRAPGLVSVWHLDGSGEDSTSDNDGQLRGSATFVPADTPIRFLELSPDRGDRRGGNEIRLIGDFPEFDGPPEVVFGAVPSEQVRIIDERTLGAVVPPSDDAGSRVDVRVHQGDFEGVITRGFVYTPGLFAPDRAAIGSRVTVRVEIVPRATLLFFVGVPPAIDLPVRRYAGRLNVMPLVVAHTGEYAFQSSIDLPFDLPPSPGLVGKTVFLQSLSGPDLGSGVLGSFSNLQSLIFE